MDHALISTIALSLLFAFPAGLLAARLGLPPLVGYLIAGICIGPNTPGLVADSKLAAELSEIGVMLLMFGVGLHFSFQDLLKVRRIALPGAIGQITLATLMGAGVAHFWGWNLAQGLILGLSLSVASTVVLLRALEELHALETVNGRIAVGWLIVEDLVMVLALVMLPALGGLGHGDLSVLSDSSFWLSLGMVILKIALFVGVMMVVGTRVVPWLLNAVVRTDSRELFTLAVIASALGIAYAAAVLFGVSFALGAFLAGVVINGSHVSHRVASDALPLQDAFAVLFFVSVGMLFDPRILIQEPWHVLAVIGIITIGKSLAAFLIVLLFKYSLNTALTVSASLAQIGEFSFILAGLGIAHGLLPPEGQSMILAGALISITLNPLLFRGIRPIQEWIERRPTLANLLNRNKPELLEPSEEFPENDLRNHVVLIGYGRVGRKLGELMQNHGVNYIAVEHNRHFVELMRKQHIPVIYGDASLPGILEHTALPWARVLVVTSPDPIRARRIIELARRLNPDIDIIVRTHSDDELHHLRSLGVGTAVMGEHELAASMGRHVLERYALA